MNTDLTGKRAVVCGSTQGIGKAAAIELALLGAEIILIARNEEKLKGTAAELEALSGRKHHFIVADFNEPEKLKIQTEAYAKQHQVHILVNNTGGPPPGPAIEATTEDFLKAFSNHLICNHILAQTFVPGMKVMGYGRIINVISTSVKIPISGLGVSNTTRGAVASWAKTLSMELGPFGITVNNVLPGAIMTARHESVVKTKAMKDGISEEAVTQQMISEIPARRIGEPHEIGAAIAFLATPAAAYINGVNLPVDGGRTGSL